MGAAGEEAYIGRAGGVQQGDKMNNNETSKRVFSFIAGLSIGAVVAALWAPKAGVDLRGDISDGVADGVESVRRTGKNLKGKVQKFAANAKDRVEEAVDAGTDAYHQAKGTTE